MSSETQFHLCHYAASHDKEEFPNAESFIPERWLRDGGAGGFQHHPYSFIPFGVGVRACVGKRVAEMEIYFALSRTQFHLCHYAASHDKEEFPNAESFIPERWLRDGGAGGFQHHPYSFIPFGVGVRACVGKRVAEMEIYFALSRTQFHLCHYAASHDKEEFPNAESFIPERWLRDGGAGGFQHHPYSFIPFGVGMRACVGKRVAEMEIYFALSRLMQHYEVHPEEGAPSVQAKTRTLLIPAQPINLRFIPRG